MKDDVSDKSDRSSSKDSQNSESKKKDIFESMAFWNLE